MGGAGMTGVPATPPAAELGDELGFDAPPLALPRSEPLRPIAAEVGPEGAENNAPVWAADPAAAGKGEAMGEVEPTGAVTAALGASMFSAARGIDLLRGEDAAEMDDIDEIECLRRDSILRMACVARWPFMIGMEMSMRITSQKLAGVRSNKSTPAWPSCAS